MKNYFKNDKITLRALEPDDIELLYSWENNEEIWNVSQTLAPFSKHILAIYIQNSDKDIYESKQLRLMIDDSNNHTVGAIDLFDFDPFNQRLGIGILIQKEADRSQGFAKSALALMIDYCFDKLKLHQVYANIGETNVASINLFSQVGFRLEGTKKDWLRVIDGWEDEHLYQLINTKFH